MVEIYNNNKNESSGFILVTSFFIMLLLMSLVLYVTSFTLAELRIAQSQAASVQTYYLAESAIAEAIWKIKNNPNWKNEFENSTNWSIDYTRNSALYPNGSYRIQINNSDLAKGEIIVTAYLNLMDGKVAQRVVKTNVYKALGVSPIGQNSEYADGNLDMSGTILNTFNGGFFSNNNIIINYWSIINAAGEVAAVNNININHSSHIVASSTKSKNINPPPPDPIPMPSVSFDNPNDSNSYKIRANNIYTEKQFEDLLWANRGKTLILNGINYVTGDIRIKGDIDLIINGVLVADGDINLGENTLLCCWGISCGRSSITINTIGTTTPSGLLSKGDINFEFCLENFNGHGLIYANDKINILSLPNKIDIIGALIGRKITLTSLWQGINITYDNSVVNYTLGNPIFSPIITVEHWEEEY